LKLQTIPSSAAVERIFSVGGAVFTKNGKKRGKLNDDNFEKTDFKIQ